MDIIISSVVSILATILVGWFFFVKQKVKNEITHFSINSYDVGKGLHDVFPKFHLQYEGKELLNKVLVLKGGFINSGDNDITDLDGKSDIYMTLPDGCTVKEIKIRSSNERLVVKARKEANKQNIIKFGIKDKFLSGDVFNYTAIVEAQDDYDNLYDQIDYSHRIANTLPEINSVHVGKGKKTGRMRKEKLLGIFTLIMGVLILGLAFSYIFVQQACSIKEKTTGKEVYVYITPQSQVYVSYNKNIPLISYKLIDRECFSKNYSCVLKTKFSWTSTHSKLGVFYAVMSLLYIILACSIFYRRRKRARIIKLLDKKKSIANNQWR